MVIGLSDYKHPLEFNHLPGARDDAQSIADLLESTYGFFVDPIIGESDSNTLRKRREQFIIQSRSAEVVLIYFAGHGLRHGLSSFLVPTSASVGSIPRDLLDDCLETNALISDCITRLPSCKRIFIFDCCRSNAQNFFHANSGGHYHSQAEPAYGPDDFAVYSTSLDKPAMDNYRTFTQQLVSEMQDPGHAFAGSVQRACERIASAVESTRRFDQAPQIRHRGSSFDSWRLRSTHSDYKDPRPAVVSYTELTANISALAVAQTGRYFAAASGETSEVRVVHANGFDPVKLVRSRSKVYSIDFSPGGEQVAFGCKDGSIGLWNHQTDAEPNIFANIFAGPVNHIEWARKNDRIIAVSTDRSLRVFQADRCQELARGVHHKSWVWTATMHRDGDHVVTGSRDRACRLWNIDRTRLQDDGSFSLDPGEILNFAAPVRSVRFSPSGAHLAVGTQDGTVALYAFDANSARLTLDFVARHGRAARYADEEKLVNSLNHYRSWKRKSAVTEKSLNDLMFVVSLDFSPDDLVLAYGTNIDGYYLYALDVEQTIGGMETHISNRNLLRYRASNLRYCGNKKRLYIACGATIHCLQYQ